MSREYVVSVVSYKDTRMANNLTKPKENVWYVRLAILETAMDRDRGKWCS